MICNSLLSTLIFCTVLYTTLSYAIGNAGFRRPTQFIPISERKKYIEYANRVDDSDQIFSPYWDNFERTKTPKLYKLNFNKNDLITPHTCQIEQEACKENEYYRRIDGFCNNIAYPSYGSVPDPMARLLQPVYDDGIMRMRSVNGHLLPNPRIVSNHMKSMKKRAPKGKANIFWLFFGQFVDHDLLHIPRIKADKIKCEECSSWKLNSGCAPILIPISDEHLSPFDSNGKRKCLPFERSSSIPSKYLNDKSALEQINVNTAALDLSVVYGSDKCTEKKLRLYHYGQVIEEKHPFTSKGLLQSVLSEEFDDCRSLNGRCPLGGDNRSFENQGILFFHIIFLREHNRLATSLYDLNKHWRDERIFQEARRINIAKFQRIVYEEFLPILLGRKQMELYDLLPSRHDLYYEGYDPTINLQILNEFSTAVFRTGHTMVPNHIVRLDKFYLPVGSFSLESIFRNASNIYRLNIIDEMARGMIASYNEAVDPIVEDSLRNKLFINSSDPRSGRDLVAINIARGRDHGIPGYTAYRQLCDLRPITSWDDVDLYSEDIVPLKKIYSSVHDIDLFVGGLAEKPVEGSLVGPTFRCIISQQFLRTKKGDRFWFENKYNSFTTAQLAAIKEGPALFNILALNLDDNTYLPTKMFKVPDKKKNPLVSTKFVKGLDLSHWKEKYVPIEKDCVFKGKNFKPRQEIHISNCLHCFCDSRNEKISCVEAYEKCDRQFGHLDEGCKIACGSK